MKYTLVVPCAGLGLRTKQHSKHINKALITVGQKPVICHIIDNMRPLIDRVVIALGYKGDMVKQVIQQYYKGEQSSFFTFVQVDRYQGPGSGLGYTLLQCEKFLQKPFIFSSNDTITSIMQYVHDLRQKDVLFYSDKKYDIDDYRTLTVLQNTLLAINPKMTSYDISNKPQKDIMYPYIGTCVVWDYKRFWTNMHANQELTIRTGEVSGFDFESKIYAYKVKYWYDLGNSKNIVQTQELYQSKTKNILPKQTEGIWFTQDDRVIKFNIDQTFISDRVKRLQLLGDVHYLFPKITNQTTHTYAYNSLSGTIMSKIYDRNVFKNVLNITYDQFWTNDIFDIWDELSIQNRNAIYDFYYGKTVSRLNAFLNKYEIINQSRQTINNVQCPSITKLLDAIDFNRLVQKGLYTKYFHGDYHMENILVDKHHIFFLDWRQNFGKGNIVAGDVYYDLAKFKQSLIVSHENIKNHLYWVRTEQQNIYYDIMVSKKNIDMLKIFDEFVAQHNFDKNHIDILTALVFLNIAVLHQPDEYSLFLFYLGKDLLNKALKKQDLVF